MIRRHIRWAFIAVHSVTFSVIVTMSEILSKSLFVVFPDKVFIDVKKSVDIFWHSLNVIEIAYVSVNKTYDDLSWWVKMWADKKNQGCRIPYNYTSFFNHYRQFCTSLFIFLSRYDEWGGDRRQLNGGKVDTNDVFVNYDNSFNNAFPTFMMLWKNFSNSRMSQSTQSIVIVRTKNSSLSFTFVCCFFGNYFSLQIYFECCISIYDVCALNVTVYDDDENFLMQDLCFLTSRIL